MQTIMSFNFNEKEVKNKKYDQDTFVGVFCILALIFTMFFILVPEKNIEKAGISLDEFHSRLNIEWTSPYIVKEYLLEDRVKKADELLGKTNIQEKMEFLLTVHSILMEQKFNPNRIKYLSQIMKDRQVIVDYLVKEFKESKETNFNCMLADCKEKEYKVIQEKLDTIKLINLKLNFYYLDLINLYENNQKNKMEVQDIKLNIHKALTANEQKQYEEMK